MAVRLSSERVNRLLLLPTLQFFVRKEQPTVNPSTG
jgi:hypothetical protein